MLSCHNLALATEPYWGWVDHSWQLKPGMCGVLRADNGQGKSTYLRLLAGFLPKKGSATWYEQPLATQHCCYLSAHPQGMMGFSCEAWLARQLYYVWGKTLCDDQILSLLTIVGLEHELKTACHQLSSGQQKRLQLATAWGSARPV